MNEKKLIEFIEEIYIDIGHLEYQAYEFSKKNGYPETESIHYKLWHGISSTRRKLQDFSEKINDCSA